ncbi:hypothetical protein EDD22DRAFT_853199 [Suillus occidentalis]|nr:hypothetical protein EDD22DRAFT_853199 [Suillus occidentalis]
MSSDSDTISDDSRSSGYNDRMEAILMNAKLPENNSSRSTPEFHWGCTKHHGHGQGSNLKLYLPTMSLQMSFNSELNDMNNRSQWYKLEARSQGGGLEDADESHRKPKRTKDDSTPPRNFGHDVSNIRAMSVPIIGLRPEKRRKVGGNLMLGEEKLLAKVMQEVEGMHEAYRNKGLQPLPESTGPNDAAIYEALQKPADDKKNTTCHSSPDHKHAVWSTPFCQLTDFLVKPISHELLQNRQGNTAMRQVDERLARQTVLQTLTSNLT